MKSKIIFLAAFASLFFIDAQAQKTDSLKRVLAFAKEDTNKVSLYFKLSWAYQWSYPDTALMYSLPGLQLAKKLGYTRGEIRMMYTIGEALAQQGNYSKGLELQLEA